MHEPPTPIKDADLLPWARRLVDYLRECRVQAGPGLRLRRSSSGSLLSVAPSGTDARPVVPLHIIGSKPPYIPAASPPASGTARRYYIEWGTLNDQLAANWDSHHDITETTYFFAKATLRTTDTLLISFWEIILGEESNTHATADWLVGDPRPAEAVYLLGSVLVDESGSHHILNSGGGSLTLTEHISQLQAGTGYGETLFGKQLTFGRNPY